MDSVLDAIFMREGAMVDANHDDSRRGFTSEADAKGVQQCALHLLLKQIGIHCRPHSTLPDNGIKLVWAERSQLLGIEKCLGTCWLHPDVGAGSSDEVAL